MKRNDRNGKLFLFFLYNFYIMHAISLFYRKEFLRLGIYTCVGNA